MDTNKGGWMWMDADGMWMDADGTQMTVDGADGCGWTWIDADGGAGEYQVKCEGKNTY